MDRRVTFLELFFDLVFVVIIAQLAHHLATHPTLEDLGWFAFLFFAVWSSWLNGTMYHELHATNDVSIRVFTFVQMGFVSLMAVFVGDVPGDGSAGFAMAYGANAAVLAVMWYRTGLHDPSHRPASNPYAGGYIASAAAFLASAFVDPPVRYGLWFVGFGAELASWAVVLVWRLPAGASKGDPPVRPTPSMVERFGLLVIIVLGEVVVGAVNGMAELDPLDPEGMVVGMLGVLVAIGIWWIYFDLVSHQMPHDRRVRLWLFGHLPLVVAIAAGGASVLNAVEHLHEPLLGEERWLLAGSLALALASIAALTLTLAERRDRPLYRLARRALLASAGVAMVLGFTDLNVRYTLMALVALLLVPVAMGLVVWSRGRDEGEGTQGA